jgi:hypothetical protein
MNDLISYPGLIASLLLPWFTGVVFVRVLLRKSGRYNWFIVIGQGYFAGIFATTLLMRLSDWAGAGLHFRGLAAVLALPGIVGAMTELSQRTPGNRPGISVALPHWQKAVVAVLLALLAWRYLTLLQELLLRPLFAWDAWMNWAPKAIVWFHLEQLVGFVNPDQWLSQAPGMNSYTLGNSQASEYPPAVPLILLWSMLGAGTWDHSHLFLPWFLATINLGLALYGHLRLNGSSVLAATVACYLLLSMPFLNVHTALAGYADIWVAATFGLAVFALSEWHLNRSASYGVLLLLMTFFCSQLKVPGIALALILIAIFIGSVINLEHRTELVITCSLAVVIALVFWFTVDVEVPHFGRVIFHTNWVSIPGLGDFSLEFHSVWRRFLESMFIMINWNIFWYLLAALLLHATLGGELFRRPEPATLAVAAALAFIFVVLSLKEDHLNMTILATLNRALIYPVPALMFYLFKTSQRGKSLAAASAGSHQTPTHIEMQT